MGRLRRGVDHQLDLPGVVAEDPLDLGGVADVDVLPLEGGVLLDQPLGDVRGRGLGAEESGPHVVLDPDHVEPLADEVVDGLGADQAAGSSDDRYGHGATPFPRRGF